jgi:hypothetical protein
MWALGERHTEVTEFSDRVKKAISTNHDIAETDRIARWKNGSAAKGVFQPLVEIFAKTHHPISPKSIPNYRPIIGRNPMPVFGTKFDLNPIQARRTILGYPATDAHPPHRRRTRVGAEIGLCYG